MPSFLGLRSLVIWSIPNPAVARLQGGVHEASEARQQRVKVPCRAKNRCRSGSAESDCLSLGAWKGDDVGCYRNVIGGDLGGMMAPVCTCFGCDPVINGALQPSAPTRANAYGFGKWLDFSRRHTVERESPMRCLTSTNRISLALGRPLDGSVVAPSALGRGPVGIG